MPPALQSPFVQWALLSAAVGALAYFFVRKELRTRAIAYSSFLIACLVLIWPPFDFRGQSGKIHLGLDLKGGMHLVLQVVVDDAFKVTIDDGAQATRDELQRKGIVVASVEPQAELDGSGKPTARYESFLVSGVEPARVKDAQDWLRSRFTSAEGWEIRERGEGNFLVGMTDFLKNALKVKTVGEVKRTLERRVDQLGVVEPVITEHGSSNDQILVQLPGVEDPEQAKRVLKRLAKLELSIVEGTPQATEEAVLAPYNGKEPANLRVVPGTGSTPGERVFYLVKREAAITGRDLKNARAAVDQETAGTAVHFTLNPQGAERFRRVTGSNVDRQLAIILDDVVYSAPVIRAQISDEGQITGIGSAKEADELSKVLRAGALPANVRFLQELSVGASLGRDSIRSGIRASIAGMAFITIFMLFYYRFSGINAVVALLGNVIILLGAMAYSGASLTLPGIAGIILTVGVGVDTNVLVFERIREELRNGKTVRIAVQNGFDRVWITIIDTHATALIAAAFLFQFGTGPVKGFAVTLVIGLVANVFASYFVSKFLFEWVLGKRQVATLSI
jgi:preprotein translocase subunit SecD